jgi:hypothetical protein
MLRTVPTAMQVSMNVIGVLCPQGQLIIHIPLREVLVTTNVSTLAGLTTFARLGVAIILLEVIHT